MSTATRSSRDMLEWQYKTLLGELQQIELHISSGDCPCILKGLDPAEYCLAKHTLNVATLAAETANMDPPQAKLLEKLNDEAQEKHDKIKAFVCHKGELPELVTWARNARKKIEPLYYACRLKVGMHQDPMVKISGKCQGNKSCTIKVTATEGVAKESSIGNLGDAIESVLRELDQRKVKPASPLTFAVGPTTLTKYELENVLVEAEDLIVSHNPVTFEPNPDYPVELQPRLRGRQANRSQVQQISQDLDADVLLTDYHSIDRGAPIIGRSDNVVESGNGRTMAVQLAISEFPASYARYRTEVIARAASLGLSEDQAKSMTHPAVVRRRLTDVPRRQFVEEANASTTLAPSAIEIARSDASHITPEMVGHLWVGDDQGIEDALRSLSNGEFVSAFLSTVPANERAQITDARGQLNQDGVRRMVMALFVNAFPGDSGLRLAEKFFESTEPTVRNVFNGIAQALGRLAKTEALCRSGDRDPLLAIGEDLAAAVVAFADIKKTPGMTVPTYLAQAQMFERRLNPFQEVLLRLIDERSRSGKKTGQILKAYASVVSESAPPSQTSLIPLARMTKDEALDAAVRRATSEEQSTRLLQQPKSVTHCNALTVAHKELTRIIKSLASSRNSLAKAQGKLGPALRICGGQATMFQKKAPKLSISGKCGDTVETCTFTVKREGEKIKTTTVGGVLDAIDVLAKEPCPEVVARGGKRAEIVAKPLKVELGSTTFEMPVETIAEMTETANATTKRELGFPLCKDNDGAIRPGVKCVGKKCSIHIHGCTGKNDVGTFHTHPTAYADAWNKITQRSHSVADLRLTKPGHISCISGSAVDVITCASPKVGENPYSPLRRTGSHAFAYIHPGAPQDLKEQIRKQKVTRFNPRVGAQFEYVEIAKLAQEVNDDRSNVTTKTKAQTQAPEVARQETKMEQTADMQLCPACLLVLASDKPAKKVCTPAQMDKRESCIQDLKAVNIEKGCKPAGTGSKRCPNVFAACTAAIDCRPGRASERN